MTETIADLEEFAAECGYLLPQRAADGRTIAIMPLMFTTAIIVYRDEITVDDRWCYGNLPAAMNALEEWKARDFADEPIGWHRHPYSGRRRDAGDPAKERVAP